MQLGLKAVSSNASAASGFGRGVNSLPGISDSLSYL